MTSRQLQSHQAMRELKVWYKKQGQLNYKINSSYDAYKYLIGLYDPAQLEYRETFFALYMNRSNYVISWSKISEGGISSTIADGKLIFAQALKVGASGVIISHCHPSGNMKASSADIVLTSRFKKFGEFIGITILDHILINGNQEGRLKYLSFIDDGIIK